MGWKPNDWNCPRSSTQDLFDLFQLGSCIRCLLESLSYGKVKALGFSAKGRIEANMDIIFIIYLKAEIGSISRPYVLPAYLLPFSSYSTYGSKKV